ncbi:mucin-5AC-like [Anopheles aquasalis]|uniref:mucin-5AC-like n=1 Tax=Anopheles aquasalis TaxID=42839 RepID=UPI00215A39FB|nr:mucin-5AC-like [Anopheles aquasalis]
MTPPPPPPPPTPGTPSAPMTPSNGHVSPPPPPPAALVSPSKGPANDHNDQLMAAIRAGITLNPTKTNDRSTPGFIQRSNGVVDTNGKCDQHTGSSTDEQGIDVIKDALQAELRNTLKRKIKKQEIDDGDCTKNEEIERSIEATRSEIQLKVNGTAEPAGKHAADTPKVENPLKTLVDVIDKERGVVVAAAPAAKAPQPKQPSPVLVKKVSSPITSPSKSVDTPKTVTPTAVSGNTVVVNVSPTPWKKTIPATTSPTVPTTSKSTESNHPIVSSSPWKKTVSPTTVITSPKAPSAPKTVANETAKSSTVSSPQTTQPEKVTSPGVAPAVANLSAMFNGGSATNTLPKTNGTLQKAPTRLNSSPAPATTTNSFSNTLPRVKAPPTVKSSPPSPMYTATVKVPIASFTDSPRNVTRVATMEPLTIDTATSNGGTGSLPTTPKELLSPQVRSGTASIRPSQIRTLTKAGSPVSHTDILETPKTVTKLPVTLIEPAPVLTAAAATSPAPATPPASPRNGDSGSKANPVQPPKERTFERAPKETKSPLNRWNDGATGGTARKLLISHGRPNFTIKRSNSRQGFDVDVADSKDADAPKPVFRILTDLENSERAQDEQQQQQQQLKQQPTPVVQHYVSFAKDLSNAPNNHPDVAVVTKTLPPKVPSTETDPFLATLKDIKIDIDEMKVVVQAKDS